MIPCAAYTVKAPVTEPDGVVKASHTENFCARPGHSCRFELSGVCQDGSSFRSYYGGRHREAEGESVKPIVDRHFSVRSGAERDAVGRRLEDIG